MELGSVLELKLGQKWRYGALKACYRLKLISSKNNSGFNSGFKGALANTSKTVTDIYLL